MPPIFPARCLLSLGASDISQTAVVSGAPNLFDLRQMPRGAKPKVYPSKLVRAVARLYAKGHTQAEVAKAISLTQKIVWRLMRRHGLRARVAAKRSQKGPLNSSWKSTRASYSAYHLRVIAARGQPSKCEHCGTQKATRFEWANMTGNYADVNDYKRLCASCHHKFDGTVRNLGAYAQRKGVRP